MQISLTTKKRLMTGSDISCYVNTATKALHCVTSG